MKTKINTFSATVLTVACSIWFIGCSYKQQKQQEEPPAHYKYVALDYSFPVTNCSFIGFKTGLASTNIEGVVLLGKELESTNSWVLIARLKSGRILTFNMPTNDPIDYGWNYVR